MKIIYTILLAVLLVPMALAAQTFKPKPYLPQAPYGGLKEKVDSIVVNSYLAKNGLQTALVVNAETTVFDKNGYKIMEKTEALNVDGDFVLYDLQIIQRDRKSLPVEYIIQDQNSRLILKLQTRENNKEIYKASLFRGFDDVGKDTTTLNKYQIIEYGDSSMTSILKDGKAFLTKKETYNQYGKLARLSVDGDKFETNFKYDDSGLLTQMSIEDGMTKSARQSLTFIFKNHLTTKNKTHTLVTCQQTDADGKIIGFVETKIYYRK